MKRVIWLSGCCSTSFSPYKLNPGNNPVLGSRMGWILKQGQLNLKKKKEKVL